MEGQQLFNIAMGFISTLCGWVLKALWDSLKELKEEDKHLADKVATIEVLVVGSYVKRDDLEKLASAMFDKLDRIENKLDKKVDR